MFDRIRQRLSGVLRLTGRSLRLLGVLAVAGMAGSGCDIHGIVAPGTLTSITVTPNATLVSGASQQMLAVGRDADGRILPISPTWAVVASGGAVSTTGLFVAGPVAGLFPNTMTASVGLISGSASITVTPGPLATITVVPTPVTLQIGGTQQFIAVGTDANGNVVQFVPTWSVVAGGGAVDGAGLFTAGQIVGTFANSVQASSRGIKAFATVIVTTGPLAAISVAPNPDTLAVGTRQQFVAVGLDAGGNIVPIVPTWSLRAGGGTLDGAGLFTAGPTPGTYTNTIQASSGGIAGRATVVVTAGSLATITVTPNPATMAVNGSQRFTAVGTDVAGTIVAITPIWDVVAGGGTIDNTGLFTAGTRTGTFANAVRASSGGRSGFATVIVSSGPLATITVTPNPVFMPTRSVQPFIAVGYDASGNVFVIAPTWSVAAGGGTIDGTGRFTAGSVAGTYVNTVTATVNGMSGRATVTVNPDAPSAQTIAFVQPATPAVYGSSFGVAPTATSGLAVTVTASGGCTIAGSSVTMTSGITACILTATQAGDAVYSAATPVARTVAGVPLVAAVTPSAAGKLLGAADPVLTGTLTGFLAGDAVTASYTRVPGEAVGTYVISATLGPAGVLGNYTIVSNTALFTISVVPLTAQTIAFVQPITPAVYGSTFAVTATATSGLGVAVTASGGCTIAGASVTMTSGITACVLTAAQAGDAVYSAATPVVRTVAAVPLVAAVTPSAAGKLLGAADPVLTGTLTGFLAGDAVTASYTRVAGEAVGTYVISATLSPAGVLSNYSVVSNTALFTISVVPLTAQTLAFGQPATPAVYGRTFAIAPTASSGLAVTVTASGGCTISGATVTMTSGALDCVLTASQAGNATYSAATPIVRTVAATRLAASVTPTAAGKAFGAADPVLAGTISGFLAGDAVTASYTRVAGEAVGTYVISATLSPIGVLGNYTITYNSALFAIGAAAQTLTFAQPPSPAIYGSTFAIVPTASSALAVTVTAAGGCSIAGTTVTMTSGTVACVLTAAQAGDASHAAAPTVVRTVAAAPLVASVTPNAAGKLFGAADPTLTGTLTGFLAGDAVTASYTRAAGEAVGTYVIGATLSPAGVLGNYTIVSNTALFTISVVPLTAQTIAFVQPTTPAVYGSSYAIAPTASSGLTVTVTPSGGCTIVGATVTMTSGTVACVLTASQAGDATYGPATSVVRTVAASPLAASATPNASGKTFGAADPALTGTLTGFLSADGVTATYSRVAGEAVGTYVISATLSPFGVLANYAITSNSALFTISSATQSITFAQPTTPSVYGSSFVIAPAASSGLTVSVTPSGGCTIASSTVTMTSGTVDCVLTATQAGNASFTAATTVVRTVVAALLAASITPTAAGKTFGAVDPAPLTTGTLTGFLAGDAVTASYTRVAGEAVGTYVISATPSAAGGASVLTNYSITSNTALFTIGTTTQTIAFAQPVSPAAYGSSFIIAPSANSGLTVTVTPSGGCTVAGSTVTMTSGTTACVLTATQPGDASYTAAGTVVRTVAASLRAASVTPNAAGKLFGAADPVPLTTGTLTGFLAGDLVTATYSRAAGEAVGTYLISAALSPVGVLGNYSITSNTALFTISSAAQTITFAQPTTPATYGSSFGIAPTASSGLTVSVTPSGGCTISGGTVTMTSGTVDCVLTATQAGNASYTAATTVVRTVAASPLAASVTPNAAGKLFGAADPVPLTTGTLTGFLAGDAVTATYTRTVGEAVGAYTISATLSPAGVLGNYTIVSNTALFTISVVPLTAQTIAFAQPITPAVYGSTFAVTATASSSLAVTVTASGGCTIAGTTVTMTSGAVDCVLTANQAGDATYSAATPIVRTVAAARLAASVTPTAAGKAFGAADPALTGTLTGFLAGDAVTASYSRVAGETVGTYVISATLSPIGVLGNYTITYNTALFTIGSAAQTITFAQPTTPAVYGSTFAVAPTASSGLTVTVTPSGGCTISGSTVTITSGTVACVLTATQAGNASYTAATTVVRTVAASPLAASVTPNSASKVFGGTDPIFTGTLSGFLASDAVTATYARTAGEALGTYTISGTLSPAGVLSNYAITYNTAVFTIGLHAAASFAVLGGTGASSCTGVSSVAGNVGVDPTGTISGFPSPCAILAPGDGTVHLNDATAAAAQADVTTATAALAAMACTTDLTGLDLGTMTLSPGVYCFTSSAQLTGTVTLNGPATGIWVFKIGTTLTTAASSSVTLAGTAQAGNVYWKVGTSATLGATNASFRGNIIASASITIGAGTSLTGRALAKVAVTMDTNVIVKP